MNKKILNKINTTSAAFIILAILVVFNVIAYKLFYRFDLTQNKDYSISSVSKETVKNLDDLVNIKVYFSKDLPQEYVNLPQEVKDLLDEYVNYSGGKIKVEFIDPGSDEKTAQELARMGIPSLQFNVRRKDKFEVTNGYLGIGLFYGDKKEILPVVESTANFEYTITSAIKKITQTNIAVVGIAQGNGEFSVENDIAILKKELEKVYTVQTVDLSKGDLISPDIKTLLIMRPKEEFTEREQYIIDQFLMAGGGLILAQDGVAIDNKLAPKVNNTGLEKLLASYGLTFNHDLVLDVSNEMVPFNSGFVSFFLPYPFWPKILKDGFSQDSVITSKLETLVLPWVSSVSIDTNKLKDNQNFDLAKTTDRGWVQTSALDLNPQGKFNPSEAEKGSKVVAAITMGKLQSAFSGKEHPVKEKETSKNIEPFSDSASQAKIALIGDADFINDNIIRRFPGNLVFVQNIVDAFTLDDALIKIRAKAVTERPLKELSDAEKTSMKYFNIFGLAALVIVIGIARFYLRNKNK